MKSVFLSLIALSLICAALMLPQMAHAQDSVYVVRMMKPRVSSELSYQDAFVKIDFVILSRILFKLLNKSQAAVEIDWAHASFIDSGSGAHQIIHEGIRYIERDKAPPPTVVPPGANVSDTILPADYVSFESSSSAGWKVRDIFEGGRAKNEGKTIGVFLPIRIRGVAKNYQFTFKVEKDLIAWAKWLREMDLRSDELARTTISKNEFGDNWPLIVDSAVIACGRRKAGEGLHEARAVFAIVSIGVYALNITARGMTIDGKPVSDEIRDIENDNAKFTDLSGGNRLREMALGLCK